jgi:negative regulator of sigma-B (phosphoserine phosphatase)
MIGSEGTRRVRGLEWGVAVQPLAGEPACGDVEVVESFPSGVLVGAIDGLGHGEEAAQAARRASAALAGHAHEPVTHLVRRCHDALVESRGAVMSLASFNLTEATLTWTGVGNVSAVLFRAGAVATPREETLLLRGGVVGFQLPALSEEVLSIGPGDTLLLATDGVHPGFAQSLTLGAPPQELAERILGQHLKGTDDALVLVARFVGAGR